MSFSPRPRPQTVNLSFTDQDITDTYRDDRSTVHSSPQHRHARGDTPLSRRQLSADDYSSPGRWTVSSRRSGTGSERGGMDVDERAERSNLDKLLDFLDDDDAQDCQKHQKEQAHPSPGAAGRSYATSTPPPPSTSSSFRQPPPPSTIRPSTSRRSTIPPSSTSHSPSSTRATESPSVRAHHRSLSSISAGIGTRSNSALARFTRTNGGNSSMRADARGVEVPDSPSPRPGSVAALRRNGEGNSALDPENSFTRGGDRSRARDGEAEQVAPEYVEDQGGEYVEEEREEQSEREGTEGGSLDSVARVAQAAMDEFDTIISYGIASSSRSASRLRNIPSPTRTPTPPSARSAGAPLPPPPPQYPASISSRPQVDDEINAHLVQELRDAQDYIAFLQDELRSISSVVVQLRKRPTSSPARPNGYHRQEALEHSEPRDSRSPRRSGGDGAERARQEEVVVEETGQAAFGLVKHILTQLPSLSPSYSTPPSLHSLSSALSFARQVDQLAHNVPRLRRDEDVFEKGNLEKVLVRVKGWERAVRAGER
ncbi:hypothetical protein JCM11641_005981 [Rhodosporidiobolus odoratus]